MSPRFFSPKIPTTASGRTKQKSCRYFSPNGNPVVVLNNIARGLVPKSKEKTALNSHSRQKKGNLDIDNRKFQKNFNEIEGEEKVKKIRFQGERRDTFKFCLKNKARF